MKKILTSLLLVTLLVQVMGYYLVFRYRQLEIKREMKIYLLTKKDNKLLSTFEFSSVNAQVADPDLEWTEQGEFSYRGKMFDVVDKRLQAGKIIIQCIEDKKETSLLKTFEEILKHESPGSKNLADALLQLVTSPYELTTLTIIDPPAGSFSLSYSNYNFLLSGNNTDILTPPPRKC